jgi:hypothetical protein
VRNTTKQRLALVALAAAPLLFIGAYYYSYNDTDGGSRFAEPVVSLFKDGFESPGSGGGDPPPPDFCNNSPTFIDPLGWQPIYTDWANALGARDGNPLAVYPEALSYPVALGTNIGTALVVKFVPNPNQSVNLYFDFVQSRPQDGYNRSRPADAMFVGITECSRTTGQGRVDLRPPVQGALDPLQQPRCRVVESGASLVWTTGNSPNACQLTAGKTYYLIVSPVDPKDGLTPGEHTCRVLAIEQAGCDVGAVSSPGPG